jgi:hypothetical protein
MTAGDRNYGVSPEDAVRAPQVGGLIVREKRLWRSNWRAVGSCATTSSRNRSPLPTRHARAHAEAAVERRMRGVIATGNASIRRRADDANAIPSMKDRVWSAA